MTEKPRSEHGKTARDYLKAASAQLGKGRLVQRTAEYGVRLLSQALDEIDGWELAELAAVYDTLAMLLAQGLGLNETDAFRALSVLCGDADALRLTRGQPEPDTELLRLLRGQIVWVTVTYESAAGGRSRRVAEVAYRNSCGKLRSARTTVDFGYEDLPGRVRERMLSGGRQAVRYQLYPAPVPRPAGDGGPADERKPA
jgi:hypothetical protein